MIPSTGRVAARYLQAAMPDSLRVYQESSVRTEGYTAILTPEGVGTVVPGLVIKKASSPQKEGDVEVVYCVYTLPDVALLGAVVDVLSGPYSPIRLQVHSVSGGSPFLTKAYASEVTHTRLEGSLG